MFFLNSLKKIILIAIIQILDLMKLNFIKICRLDILIRFFIKLNQK